MTPRHELRRIIERQNLDSSDPHFRRFARQLPREWREPEQHRQGPPMWLWAAVYIAAAFVLWLYGGKP